MKTISNKELVYKFEPSMEAVTTVSPLEIVKFQANDAFNGQIQSEDHVLDDIDFSQVNPATGPVYVEGSERGDVLKVKILDMTIPDKGVTVVAPKEGVLGEMVEEARTRISRIGEDFVYLEGSKIPLRPNIGVIGVAPYEESYPTGTPWKHGGNMDTKDITEGTTVYFPVQQDGGLLALGDCHAVMGDGEVCVSGAEIASNVTVKVDVIKNVPLEWPLVETKDASMIITSGKNPKAAIQEATKQAVDLLSKSHDVDWHDAYILASLCVDLKISQMVDPTKTVRAKIPKTITTTQKLLESLRKGKG